MRSIAKQILTVAVAMTALPLFAQSPVLIKGMSHPESIISDGSFLYVTNIGKQLHPMEKDGDGSIWKLSLGGEIIEKRFSKALLNAPKGTAIVNETLYVADIDRIVGIDLTTGKTVSVIDFSPVGAQLVNDIAVKNDSVLFVSATDLNKIFQVTLGTHPRISPLDIPAIKGANGLWYDSKNQRLYTVGLGRFDAASGEGEVGYVEWKNHELQYTRLGNSTGFFDGIAQLDADFIVVSDWVHLSKPVGKLYKINIHSGKSIPVASGLGGPADFHYDATNRKLLIPATLQGTMMKVTLSTE